MNIARFFKAPTIFIAILAFLAISSFSYVEAQHHSGYCDEAKSTADFQTCITNHNEAAKEKLNKVYKELLIVQGKADDSAILQAQKNWIEYRNSQCQYEAGMTDNEALKHLYETSCKTALTEFRAAYLQDIKNRESQTMPREFSNQPRWVNILTNSYPKTYWRYGEWISVDLDCDGMKEDIMTGLNVPDQQAENKDSYKLHSTLVIAVADSPETGKPKATIHSIPIILPTAIDETDEVSSQNEVKAKKGVHLCNANVDMAIISHAAIKVHAEQTETAKTPSCGTVLQINDSTCKPLQLYKKDAEYKLEFFNPSAGNQE